MPPNAIVAPEAKKKGRVTVGYLCRAAGGTRLHRIGSPASTFHILARRQHRLTGLVCAGTRPGGAAVERWWGIYGVVSYAVVRRTGEYGLRTALGAQSGDVLPLVLKQGLAPVLAGLAFGGAGAALAVGALRSFLFGIARSIPPPWAGSQLCCC